MSRNIPTGIFAGLGGGQMLQQLFLWQVASQIMGTVLAPEMAGLQEEIFKRNPSLQISVADAVNAAVRGYMSLAEAEAESRLSGIDGKRFKVLLDSAGNPPGVGELLELWRREVIPESGSGPDSISLEQGIREGQTKNKWIGPLKSLRYQLPSPQQALNALLEGQTDAATARKLYAEWGGDLRFFDLMFNTQGSAPTPLEAAMMARRGIIPWTGSGAGKVSFEQAFLEGPWRNKWMASYREAANYIPPPRATTAMLRNGSITDEQAAKFYAWAGADAEVTAALMADAHHQKTESTRSLVKSDVLTLYAEGVFDRAQTLTHLADLGYDGPTAEFEISAVDFHRIRGLIDHAVSRIHSLFVAHKISPDNALAGLQQLNVPPAQIDQLMQVWTLERAENVRILTPAEVVHAAKLKLIDEAEALTLLERDGYSPRDAWLRLAVGLGGKPAAPQPAA